MNGTLTGVGVGPGDPELLTLKAARLIAAADVVAYPCNRDGDSQARRIAAAHLCCGQQELPITLSFDRDHGGTDPGYDHAAGEISTHLRAGRDVVVLCEGDPLFYGSFGYLLERLPQSCCQVVPGITSVSAASALAARMLVSGRQSLAVIPAAASDAHLRDALQRHDSVVVLKAGRARTRIVALLEQTGRSRDAIYFEQIGREQQCRVDDVTHLPPEPGSYFALFLVSRS